MTADAMLSASASPSAPRSHLDWKQAHAALLRLQKSKASVDAGLGEWLLKARRAGTHRALGFGSFAEYIERLFGEKPRWTRERLRVAEALERLPCARRALETGEVGWSALRELTRVATPDTEAEWLGVAKQSAVRQLEQRVAGRAPGDRPSDKAKPDLAPHVLRFEVSGAVLATWREAIAKLRREADAPLSEEDALLMMARQVLGGPSDAGRSSYQLAITVCEQCNRGFQEGAGELVEVAPELVEAARCDCQHIGRVSGGAEERRKPAASTDREASTKPQRTDAMTHREPTPHVGHARASQSIPPRIRRQILRRDQGSCVVPGCRHATWVDVHHLKPRADGGDHDPDSLVVLCGAHHRAIHEGRLLVEGTVSSGLTFRHADGATYGRVEAPHVAELYHKTFMALRHLGFRETETRRTLERLRTEGAPADMEAMLRRGLELTSAALQAAE